MMNSKTCTTLYGENANYLHCTSFNASSLCNKLSELHNLIYTEGYDIIFIYESWLNVNITSGIIHPKNRFNTVLLDMTETRWEEECAY